MIKSKPGHEMNMPMTGQRGKAVFMGYGKIKYPVHNTLCGGMTLYNSIEDWRE